MIGFLSHDRFYILRACLYGMAPDWPTGGRLARQPGKRDEFLLTPCVYMRKFNPACQTILLFWQLLKIACLSIFELSTGLAR